MKFSELVNKRESTRMYSSKPVPRELIDQCLEAARLAPSASNSQPWSFIVVDDEATKNEIVDKSMSGIYSSNKFVKTAPVLIVAITEYSVYYARLGGMLRNVKYNLIDIGIACEHLVLQAAELGLGTCWLGWFSENALKKVLGLSKNTKVDVVLCMGYPAEDKPPRQKIRKPLDKIRRYY
ncbi:MAG: NAD(P)H nitroreductase [Candidatus Aminicenantes bacterium]|nr:NAD(P)H nitroreductase [Candidatus Aminicenantes bacterium]NIM78025.1 NAD(P)H nitroreductase [Candidatus Aminicenantes bacterium]NIN17345.1 NAD(P)H nitroreductase [Candidatus Aminicenantes bacterium]NIN41238.1 NAD(P)H nitroreductase [Candidatus Aminicenantes bacterium]NIN84011.1 NAD(P)H nitroreductase [Candidatus Aminicenantes bacterium]